MLTGTFACIKAKEHKDLFDRIMIAQVKSERLSFLTDDEKVSAYNEDCIIYQKLKDLL